MNRNKTKILVFSSVAVLAGGIMSALALSGKLNFAALKAGEVEPRVLSIAGSDVINYAGEEFGAFTYTAPVSLEAGGHYDVTLSFSSAKKVGETLVLESGSTITKTELSKDLRSVEAEFTGSLVADFGFHEIGDYYGSAKELVSGETAVVGGNDFVITATSETVLESFEMTYGCFDKAEADGVIAFNNTGAGAHYSVDAGGSYMTVSYSDVVGGSYDNIPFSIPSSVAELETNTLRMFVRNGGEASAKLRVDVETDTPHGTNDVYALNTSASFDGDSSRVATDLEWGGSSLTLASGEKGLLEIRYDISLGELKDIKLFIDSSTNEDTGKYSGSMVFANAIFTNEEYGLKFVAGENSPYTCAYNSRSGSTRVTYEEVEKDTYQFVTAWMGNAEQLAGKTRMTFTVKNNSEHSTQIEFNLRTDGQSNHLLVDDEAYDYFNGDSRAQFNIDAGKSRDIVLVFDQTGGAANLLEAYIDTTWDNEQHTPVYNGDVEFLNLSI